MTAPALAAFLGDVRRLVDAELARVLADPAGRVEDPGRLREAMRYAVLGGGKRLRPAVVVGACLAAGGARQAALPAATAIELLHAYTLVHDDLPAMDDDAWRRGRATVHVAFGEANAILVGDALLTAAFGALAGLGEAVAPALTVLANRAGVGWLLGGQARDIAATPPESLEALELLHAGKTGALFAAAGELGAIAAGAGDDARRRLAEYGMALGVAFQHADDVADGDHPELAAAARRRVHELIGEAKQSLHPFGGRAVPLAQLADWVASTCAPG
jgi:geranylgeranyl diphosphate synthase, type II